MEIERDVAHKQISRHLEQAEVRLLHDSPTPEEIKEAKAHILFALGLMNSENSKLKIPQ